MGNVFFTATQQNQIHSKSHSEVPILSTRSVQAESPVYANVPSDNRSIIQDEDQTSTGTWDDILIDHSNVQNEIQAPSSPVNEVLTLSNVPNKIRSKSSVQPKENLFLCKICNCAFKFQMELDKHLRFHNDSGLPLSKNNCEKTLKYVGRKYRASSGVCKKGKPFSCHICSKRFKAEKYLRQHSVSHDKKRPYPCNVCDKAFKQSSHLQRHLKFHVEKESPLLSVSKTYIQDELVMSFDTSNEVQTYHSKVCSETVTLTSSRSSKIMEASEETLFFCQICDLSFRFKRDLRKHCRIHRDSVHNSKCDICEKTFEGKNRFQTHFLSKKETCNEYQKNIWHHNSSHNDGRSYSDKSVKRLDCVERNFKTHKKTIQNIGKSEKFLLMRNRIHKNNGMSHHIVSKKKLLEQTFFKANFESHVEENRPFGCDVCDKRFKTKWVLLQHFSVHKNDTPFGCSHCMRMFKLKKYLISHLRVHQMSGQFSSDLTVNTGEPSNLINDTSKIRRRTTVQKTYSPSNLSISTEKQILCCTFCDKRFKNEAVLLQHLSVHEIDESETKSFPSNLPSNRSQIKKVCGPMSDETNDSGRTNENPREKISVKRKYSQSTSQARAKKKTFRCDVCDKQFLWKSHLEYHSVVHIEERPFVCTKCDAKYKREDKLMAHTLNRCPNRGQKLTKLAPKKYSLRREPMKLSNHPNSCFSCLDTFDHYTSLIQHTKVCSAYAELVRKEEQKVENLKFFKEENGLLHREYECSLCNEIFVRAKYFAQHLMDKHDVQFFIHKC